MDVEPFDILVGEDDEQISFLLNFMLTREGFSVNVAGDGQQVADVIDKEPCPKLVLLDVMMPYFDGFQLLEKIRQSEHWSSAPVIMLTAKSQEKDIVRALEMGANDYVVKPFQPGELTTRIKMLMKRVA